MSKINLLGGTYLARSLIASAQECLNLYPERNPQDASAPFTNLLTPGLTLKGTPLTPAPARGLYTATNGNLYYVADDSVYFISNTFIFTKLGTIAANLSTPVAMQDNGNVLVIADGTTIGYAVNLQTGILGQPLAFQLTAGGNAFVSDGTYPNIALTGGSGSGAMAAFIQIAGGTIVDMQLASAGNNYVVGDTLHASGIASGHNIRITAVGAAVNAFAQITDPNWLGSVGIGIVDTYMGFNQPNTRNFYTSLSQITFESLTSTASGQPALGAIISGGSGYTSASYTNVPLIGGTGSGATANITVAGGIVTVVSLLATGTGYQPGDLLSAANTSLGGAGSGFSYSLVEVNPSAFDPTFFVAKVGYPDLLATIVSVHREFWLFGAYESTEIWYNAGTGVPFPFQIMPGVFIQHGCIAPYSVQTHDLDTFWLSVDNAGAGTVFIGQGYTAKRISTFAIEKILSGLATLSDAIGMIYKQQDHIFYVLTFPSADVTLVYDVTESLWHTRGWTDPNTGTLHRIRASCMAFAYGFNLCGDWQNGALYALDLANFTDAGTPIVRRRGLPHILNDGKRIVFDRLALDMDCGNGIPSSPAYNPLITLEISDDRGRSFAPVPTQSMGAQGQYRTQIVWHRLGMARDRVFRISWSEPVFTALQGAWLDTTPSET